jgi:hypothetical protein
MLSGLPDRPLYEPETETLTEDGPTDLVFPASPESIQEDEEGRPQIHDLLVFRGETVATIAYVEDEETWTLVAKASDEDEDAYGVAYDKLLEYRGYEELDREDALRYAVSKLYGIPEEVIEANPDKLASLGDT